MRWCWYIIYCGFLSSSNNQAALSRWCVFHRKKAQQVVEIWDRLFQSAQQEQLVSFLYLANDVLQNSRHKGSEFVSEYLKVLPSALKFVHETGNENCRKAASRLVLLFVATYSIDFRFTLLLCLCMCGLLYCDSINCYAFFGILHKCSCLSALYFLWALILVFEFSVSNRLGLNPYDLYDTNKSKF